MQNLQRILSEKITAFCGHCTMHGFYYLQSHNNYARVLWAVIMAAGLSLCGVLSHMIWEKYTVDPFVTVVESTYYRSELIPFPAVMICDPQPVFGPKTNNITYILSSRGYNDLEIGHFYEGFTDIRNPAYVPPAYVRKMHSLLQDLGFVVETLLETFKKPCDVIMVRCRWRSKRYNCSEMFKEVFTVVGHCCHFDISYFSQFAPKNTTLKPGKEHSEALDVTVDGVKIFPNGTVKDGALLLYIFDADNTVTMMDGSISLGPSSHYDVKLEISAVDSSPDVKALSLKTRKCVLPTDRGHGASFYHKCIATLIMRNVVNYCKCVPSTYSCKDLMVDDYQHCTWDRYSCIYSQLEKTSVDMPSLIRMNECYQNCDYIEYESKVDFIKRRNLAGKSNSSTTRVAVHYARSTCMKYRRELIYTWDQMLANLGGIFGLCLGGSIISIIEIVWFLIDLLATTLYSLKRKAKLKPSVKKVAFVADVAKKQEKNKDGCYKFVN